MTQPNEELTYHTWDSLDDDRFEEEWEVIMQSGSKYTLNKLQALGLKQEIASGNRGIIIFQTFAISIPYIVDFYRIRRFLKGTKQLPERATEKPYEPIPPEEWEEFKKKVFKHLRD